MRMEHVKPRLMFLEGEFENSPLRLALHDQIDGLQRWRQRRSLIVVVEEIGMQVERVDRVKFDDIDEIDANRPVRAILIGSFA